MRAPRATQGVDYTHRLQRLEAVWWKRLLDVQRPYRWNLRRLRLGFVLDVGCGIGRNLMNLGGRGAGVGVDHNADSVALAVERGLEAFTPEAFQRSAYAVPGRFDTLLLAHVCEHMRPEEASEMLRGYLPYVRPGGNVVFITPQEAGFRSDSTHVHFMDFAALEALARDVGLSPERSYSFPFPRVVGQVFPYNEFVLVARRGA